MRMIRRFLIYVLGLAVLLGLGAFALPRHVTVTRDVVSFFFVLSGLVLSYKYLQGSYVNKRIDYKSFAIARFYRLYPAYWFCLLFYYLHTVWGTKIKVFLSLSDLLAEASLLRNFAPLYGAGWTLNIEMVLSLVMPFLILLIRYDEKLFRIFIVLSLLFSSFLVEPLT